MKIDLVRLRLLERIAYAMKTLKLYDKKPTGEWSPHISNVLEELLDEAYNEFIMFETKEIFIKKELVDYEFTRQIL